VSYFQGFPQKFIVEGNAQGKDVKWKELWVLKKRKENHVHYNNQIKLTMEAAVG